MGACASKPESCVGGKLRFSKRPRRRSRLLSKSLSLNNKLVPIDESAFDPDLSSYTNPTFRVSLDEAWFDSHPVFEPEWDDDFYSIQEDCLSTIGSESTCRSTFSSPRCSSPGAYGCFSRISSIKHRQSGKQTDAESPKQNNDTLEFSFDTNLSTLQTANQHQQEDGDHSDCDCSSQETSAQEQQQQDNSTTEHLFKGSECSDQPVNNDEHNPAAQQKGSNSSPLMSQNNIFDVKTSVLVVKVCRHRDEYDQVDDSPELQNYPVISNPCLPCLKLPSDRRRSVSPSPPGTRKKASSKVRSFKWRDEFATPLVSPRAPLQRPIAGSQIPYCPPEKRMSDCWSPIDPNTFKVRGHSFLRDKRKDLAPNSAAYYPFGVDVFRSHQKINHIARFVELPPIYSSEKIPPILVVNIQIPLYPPSVFHRENDGEGMNVVLYFRLSDRFAKDLPRQFQENVRRLIDDETEKVKTFAAETTAPFRERLKILSRLANLDDLNLHTAEKRLINAYNEKPILSRPQHEFYSGENYFEIDLDVHRFSYMCRKGLDAIQERLKHCILDFGLTIQGTKPEDLPEHLLCCIRLNEIDYTNYRHLAI